MFIRTSRNSSLTLSNKRDQFGKVRWNEDSKSTIISNPITKEHTMLRQYILPSLLNLLAANRHHETTTKSS